MFFFASCSKRERVEVAVSDLALVAVLYGLRQVGRPPAPPIARQPSCCNLPCSSICPRCCCAPTASHQLPRPLPSPARLPCLPSLPCPQLAGALGWAWLIKTYVVPYLIVNFWLVTITMLQHTHPGGAALPVCSAAALGGD